MANFKQGEKRDAADDGRDAADRQGDEKRDAADDRRDDKNKLGDAGNKQGDVKKDAADVPKASDAVFISLDGGTVMLTKDGWFRGQKQLGKVMISSSKVSRVDDKGKIKATWVPLSYSDTVRLWQSLNANKAMIMEQVDKERALSTSLEYGRVKEWEIPSPFLPGISTRELV